MLVTDSLHINQIKLVTMDSDTGDSLPIFQPITLLLKQTDWVKMSYKHLRKQILCEAFHQTSPIVVVPKRTAAGEPSRSHVCVGYRAWKNYELYL